MLKYLILLLAFAFANINCSSQSNGGNMGSIYDFSVNTIDGKEKSLADYKGKVLLVVNVASKCGFTPQYKGLEELYRKYKDAGFEVLAFPCNQFGGQEPGTNEEIASFCSTNYGVTFQLFDKIDVNGENAHPLYKFLKANAKGFINDDIKWNFTKFLVNQNGEVVDRFAPQTTPESIEKHIAELLKK
jgi:glutathione peroxidase